MSPPAASMTLVAQVRAALAKPFMPAVFFFAGVTYDGLTLTRIDRFLDNLILLLYIGLLGGLIVLVGRIDLAGKPAEVEERGGLVGLAARARPYAPMAIQFLLGGLFSAYAIFYSQSASWSADAVYFFVLVGLLVGNEFLHSRLTNLRLLVSLYALVCLSFFTYFLPVATGFMNTAMFLIGALLSAGVALKLVELVYRGAPDRPRRERRMAGLPATAVVLLFVTFYFLNWIPPVPLSLKFGGAYHQVAKQDGTYALTYAKPPWYRFWKKSDQELPVGTAAHCFTAVFAPTRITTTIYHHWQHRPAAQGGRGPFMTTDRLPIHLSGGRDAGFRGVTAKQRVTPGEWRVDVEAADGRVIGRVAFTVSDAAEPPPEMEVLLY